MLRRVSRVLESAALNKQSIDQRHLPSAHLPFTPAAFAARISIAAKTLTDNGHRLFDRHHWLSLPGSHADRNDGSLTHRSVLPLAIGQCNYRKLITKLLLTVLQISATLPLVRVRTSMLRLYVA